MQTSFLVIQNLLIGEPDASLNIVDDRKSVSYLLLTWGIAIFVGPDF